MSCEYTNANKAISNIIAQKMKALSNEEHYPEGSADGSVDKIRRLRDDLTELRNIRERLEHIFYS